MDDKVDNGKSGNATLASKAKALWAFVTTGLWSDPRRNWWINALRIGNLSLSSFLNRDIQTQACAMTYRTLLAIVPALALLLAIGRGFGMATVLQNELYHIFPAQKQAISYAITFVDTYLSQASEGIFVGVGIGVLLWTMISLIGNVEDTFNFIWGQKTVRSIWRKITDYTAMLLILPVIMVCASGLSLLLSNSLNSIFHFDFLTPIISAVLEGSQVLMTILFFTATYLLVPNTKVKFVNAFISGILAGIGFLVLQWLFVTGTLYVARYNAIYGSFAFVPLLLLWIQLVWVIIFAGAVICYSSQNVFAFNLEREVKSISWRYEADVILAIAAIIARRFVDGDKPVTALDFMNEYGLPARLVTGITDRLVSAGVINRVHVEGEKDSFGFQLAVDPSHFTVHDLFERLYRLGTNGFIAGFDSRFPTVLKTMGTLEGCIASTAAQTLVADVVNPLQTKVSTSNQ